MWKLWFEYEVAFCLKWLRYFSFEFLDAMWPTAQFSCAEWVGPGQDSVQLYESLLCAGRTQLHEHWAKVAEGTFDSDLNGFCSGLNFNQDKLKHYNKTLNWIS